MLEEAASDLADPATLALFIKPGWWRQTRKKNGQGFTVRVPNEDAITEAIVERIHQLKESAPEGSAIAANRTMSFHAQGRRRQQAGTGPKGLKDTDITAYRFDNIGLDLRIEAKVVFDEADVSNEYLTERGILRFADPASPYTREIVGGMVSYSVTEAAGYWLEQVAAGLVPMAEQVGEVERPAPYGKLLCCDIVRGDGPALKVTVVHFGLRFQTEPTSFP